MNMKDNFSSLSMPPLPPKKKKKKKKKKTQLTIKLHSSNIKTL